ncbi:uncharacterized protein LOC126756511 isoform X1 [Bactrocera neohumeralis]|uniref:uncharacterized protein LOC126756511 isoform X1 n=1 Tax=Bactrocera neohumeralis TaxID=98809 RepID=UPI0021656B70|nr:uncharacterized protein LOC126756511 isoform X1 [Bactrocera neohumeralis]XP_050325571.1 uncharacterized protein LOC126756511 isoform X1 [Bactrocera neohumeralis]
MPPKRRRRFQGLYYHSSPPKVLPMNGQSSNQGRKRRDIDDFSVKLSTIRIWMHEKDIGKLTRILWAGQGSRLCQQASTNPRVKRFLAAVPYVMNSIKDVHQAVIDNNLETLQAKMESPVPPALITCRDANGLNLIHKAAGLGHTKILEYLIGIWPDGAAETDITGKTPLHWAASHKNNMRCYTLLTEAGCDEEALDYKMKSPTYYRHKPHEIERAFLVYVPEAPRVSPDVATDWEALSEDIGDGGKKLDIKIPDTNGFHGRNTDDSIENTSEVDLNDGVSATDEEPQTAAITNGNGDDSAPQTPAEDDEEAANGAEEGGEEEPALTNGAAETNDVNGHDGAEVDVEVEDTEAAKAEAAVDADAEAEAQADVGADIKADVEADAQANPEVEATEAETNMKALNHTTTTKTNGNEEHAEQKESEAASTAVNDNKDTAESEIAENGTKIEESGETEKVEERKEESEDITNEESESNVKEVDDVKDEEQPKTAEVVDNTEDETKENESNVKEKDEMKDEDKPKTAEKKDIVNTEDETKENEVKENEIESETTNTEGKIEDTKVSDLSIEPHIESGDAHTEEYKEQTPMGEEEQQQKEAQAEATNGDEEENKAAEVQQVGEQVADHKSESEVNELELNVNNAVDETAPADTTEAVKDIVKEQKDEHENENEAATDSENETNNGYESDNEPAVDTASEHEAESEADENDDEVQVVTEPQTADKLDENHNEAKYDNGDGASSPTSSLAIEGFVTGASEDNRVQSQSAAYVHEVLTLSIQQSDIREAIEAGDMEQLAQIVLNGDGKKLVNMHSHNPDIQAFLSNVPNYMSKIRRVHEAAREGSLLALQQALDRRKFAIAKDDISPNGATPLHVAVLFGNTDIVRYLAARFPETTTITDNDGRTALHYAATINDNGHFYNVLTQLGANSKALDKLGHTPEFYQNKDEAKDILNYKQLLSNFGAEELEDELLNDQVPDDLHSSRRQLQDVDINRTLDRCFSVIEESSKALSGSAASALAHRKPLTASTLQVSVISYLSRFLKRSVFEKIRLRQTRLDHNLFDVIWPSMRKTSKVRLLEEDISCGIIAPDFDVYVVFQEFLVPLIKDMHCMSVNEDFKPHPRIAFFPMENAVRLNTAAFIFDDESNLIQRCTVECSRNLEDFELPVNLTIGQVEQAERMIMGKIFTNHFVEAIGETESGSYYTLTEILEEDSEIYATLQKLGLLIPLLDMKDTVQGAESLAFNGSLWPYGRGVYINSANNLALWLNCQEHLRVISTSSDANAANMGVAYTRVGRVISFLERELHFKESYFLGYLQARPAYLGTGLKFTTTINLPNLMKEVDNLRHLCSVRGLNLITCATSKSDVQLVNMQSLGVIEYVLFQDYCTAVTNIVSLEKDMSLTNSKHIASMLVKIFRRKKNSLVERN